ncbi:hypothetical protein SAMN05444166_6225 [Singulisphaera sp. GP187]|uniref:permease n=1 Tax=Singulisphaera sp. GP187 TaxID=1882752 RepID=UPI0009278D72|nr:permease [Singulisphaera sp. GP187]SIO59983.1 hypothetical protein SAMN05444166_6225 [Singulisphaera sp. GP187]
MIDILLLWAHGDSTVVLDLNPVRTIAGAAVRFIQAVLNGAPYLLSGVVLAGLLRGIVGAEVIRHRFGSRSLGSVVCASIFGFLLPLGALGSLPVARRLLAMGIPRGTTLAFLISASVLDPLSLVLGLSLMSPRPMAACVVAVFAWSLLAGLLINRLTSNRSPVETISDFEGLPGTPFARLARVVSSMATDCSGSSLRDLALAAAGAGLLGAFLRSGWLQQAASPPRPAGNLVTAAMGALASETPLGAMRQAGILVRDGYTHQTAFMLLASGAGFNLAILNWLHRGLRLKPWSMAAVIGIGILLPCLIGWGFDRPVREPAGQTMFHTHAFDEVERPNFGGLELSLAVPMAWGIATQGQAFTLPALLLLTLLSTAGLIARRPRIRSVLMQWNACLELPRHASGTRAWDRSLSPRLTTALGLVAAIPALIALVLTYYPAPPVLLDEMVLVHTEVQYAVRLGKADEALVWIDRWNDLIQKLGPSLRLRQGSIGGPVQVKLDELREAVAALRGFLDEGRLEEARTLLGHLDRAQKECRQAFGAVS